MLDLLYSGVARWRRRAVERRPERRRRLSRPVISVGNLSVGGTGKTPVVAALARYLVERGERPAILSRGYRRIEPVPGVVVVSDGRQVQGTLQQSGDEPLMLARTVPGAIVCVAEERYLAGVLAERTLDATVHLLDDGFQHLQLARDLDVLVTTPGQIPHGRVLPYGQLREPADAAARAHVLVVMGATAGGAASEAWALGVSEACGAHRLTGEPRRLARHGEQCVSAEALGPGSAVVAVAGIGNPQRFADDIRAAGWQLAGELWFRDHHQFTGADVGRIQALAGTCGAAAVLTTEKDAVRFESLGPLPFPMYVLPSTLAFDPADALFYRVARTLARESDAGDARVGSASQLPLHSPPGGRPR